MSSVLSCSVMSDSLQAHELQPARLLYSWDSPGKNTGVGCHALLHWIFPTQGSNPDLPHCRWILSCLSHQGSPRILERIAYPFSRGTSQARNWTGVSCVEGGFFANWATREAQVVPSSNAKRKGEVGRLTQSFLAWGTLFLQASRQACLYFSSSTVRHIATHRPLWQLEWACLGPVILSS